MNDPSRPEHGTYTPPRMESTFSRGVQTDASGRAVEPTVHVADEVRAMVEALAAGRHEQSADDVKALLARALLDAQEQERQRLAEELHDGPAQALANATAKAAQHVRNARMDSDCGSRERPAISAWGRTRPGEARTTS